MVKKVLALILTVVILTMVFSVTACEEKLPTAEEVMEKLVETHADVKSYKMEGNVVLKMVLDIPEEEMSMVMPGDMDIEADITASFDGDNEEMMMVMDIDLDLSNEATMKMAMEMYLVDDWMYVMTDMPMASPQWMKTEISYSEFLKEMESINFTETQVEFLESGNIVVTGKEQLDGVECYILEVSPDLRKLWEILIQQSQLTGGEMLEIPMDEFDEMIENIDDMIKDVSAKYWIEKDTYYIVKGDLAFNMEITPEAMGVPDEEGFIAMDITMNMRMFNYDKPVSIILPPEAADAIEESMW